MQVSVRAYQPKMGRHEIVGPYLRVGAFLSRRCKLPSGQIMLLAGSHRVRLASLQHCIPRMGMSLVQRRDVRWCSEDKVQTWTLHVPR